MARMRTFIAVDLGQQARDRLAALQQKLAAGCPGVKWVEPHNLHLTLFFLGEVEAREVNSVCTLVAEQAASHAPFQMSLSGVGCFPTTRRPRVLWAGVEEGADEIRSIHQSLEGPLLAQGCYRREERHFTPHVTIGRVRGDAPDGMADLLAMQAGWHGGQVEVREIKVLASELLPKGPAYTVLSRARLR